MSADELADLLSDTVDRLVEALDALAKQLAVAQALAKRFDEALAAILTRHQHPDDEPEAGDPA